MAKAKTVSITIELTQKEFVSWVDSKSAGLIQSPKDCERVLKQEMMAGVKFVERMRELNKRCNDLGQNFATPSQTLRDTAQAILRHIPDETKN